MHVTTIKEKKAIHLKESKAGYMGEFGGRKGKWGIVSLYYIHKKCDILKIKHFPLVRNHIFISCPAIFFYLNSFFLVLKTFVYSGLPY